MSLTDEQIEEMKRAIDRRQNELGAEIRDEVNRAREHTRPELAGPAPDPGDASVAALIAELDNSELLRDAQELRELDAARQRIAHGTYGVCTECGRDIGIDRLRAQPAARRCIECQTVYERTFAGPGAPTL